MQGSSFAFASEDLTNAIRAGDEPEHPQKPI
jgi:hypothetical protein